MKFSAEQIAELLGGEVEGDSQVSVSQLAKIEEGKIPIDTQTMNVAEELNLDPTLFSMNGGEDYELLFTVSMEDFPKIKANPNLSIIGHITNEKEGVHLITRGNEKIPLIARGWNSLDSNQE